jgi:hypothetical protein
MSLTWCCRVPVQMFCGPRRWWLEACDAVGRDEASMTGVDRSVDGNSNRDAGASSDCDVAMAVNSCDARGGAMVVRAALADRVRVSVVGDLSTRPRVCASVYGGMVAMFLPSLSPLSR